MLVSDEGILFEGGWRVVLVIGEAAAPLIGTVEDSVVVPFSYATESGHLLFRASDIVTIEGNALLASKTSRDRYTLIHFAETDELFENFREQEEAATDD